MSRSPMRKLSALATVAGATGAKMVSGNHTAPTKATGDSGGDYMPQEERARKVNAALRATEGGDKSQGSGTLCRDQEVRAHEPNQKVAQGDEGVPDM